MVCRPICHTYGYHMTTWNMFIVESARAALLRNSTGDQEVRPLLICVRVVVFCGCRAELVMQLPAVAA